MVYYSALLVKNKTEGSLKCDDYADLDVGMMRIMEQKRKPTKELKGLLRNPFRTGYLRLLQLVSCDFFDREDPRKYLSRDVDYTKRIQLVAYQIYNQFFLETPVVHNGDDVTKKISCIQVMHIVKDLRDIHVNRRKSLSRADAINNPGLVKTSG